MKDKVFFVLILILAISTILKLSILTKISLWHDEAFSALLPKYNFKEMIFRASLDVHPPFYYILLKVWTKILGNSPFTLRFFSLFFGILSVIIFYLLILKVFKEKLFALFCSILLALNSFFIQFELEARMYTLGIFLVIISSFFLLKSLLTGKWFFWIFYTIFASFSIHTHYYLFFSVFAQILFVAFWIVKESNFNLFLIFKNKNFKLAFLSFFLLFLSFLPWLKIFLTQLKQVQESYWIPKMTPWSVPLTLLKMISGGYLDPHKFSFLLIFVTLAILLTISFSLLKESAFSKYLFCFSFLIPFLLAISFSLKTSVYLDRYFIFTLPFFIALVARGFWLVEKKYLKYVLIFGSILGTLISFPLYWKDLEVEKKPGMAGLVKFLNQNVKPNEKIFVGSSFVYFTFKYYNKTGIQPKLFAPGPLLHFSGTALLSDEDIIKDFSEETKKGDIVWIINTTGFGNFQPQVPENWEKVEEIAVQDVYDYRGWILATKYEVK